MHRITKAGGYSFIEMLAVMIVLGIMMAIATRSIAPAVRQARVRNAASVLAGDLQYAQLQAVRYRRPIAILVNQVTKQLIIRDRDNPANIWRTRSLGQDSDFDLDSLTMSPATSVEVFPNGIVRQTTLFSLALASHNRTVTLNRAGQIRIQ